MNNYSKTALGLNRWLNRLFKEKGDPVVSIASKHYENGYNVSIYNTEFLCDGKYYSNPFSAISFKHGCSWYSKFYGTKEELEAAFVARELLDKYCAPFSDGSEDEIKSFYNLVIKQLVE